MPKITMTEFYEYSSGREPTTVNISKDSVEDLEEMFTLFKAFLIACGYSIEGNIEVVEEDRHG